MKKKERSEKTASAIIEAAFLTIADHSLAHTTTALISGRAKVSKPLLHYHFKTKEVLLEKVLDKLLDRLLEIPMENFNKSASPFEEIKGIFQKYKHTIVNEPALLVVFYDFWVYSIKRPQYLAKISQRFLGFRSYISQIVNDGVQKGVFSSEKSHMLPPLLLSLLEGASLQLISDPEAFNMDLYQYMALDAISSIAGKKPTA
ncbi:MAG: TetR/AcrR family transcriptional regulator [Nitrospinae bacterium]|nr:TetR/AcrR family transcriptional regulator [Nitrospinota bacterium]